MGKETLLLVIAALLIGFTAGGYIFQQPLEKIAMVGQLNAPQLEIQGFAKISSAVMPVPAVDNEGNGVAVDLAVEARNGTGKILANIDKLLFWVDTQQSIQIARSVAENVTGINTTNIDLTYAINTNATIVGGPSAGAALTIATIAVVEGKPLNKSVMITGTINPDGSVGEVGGILEKAKAAKEIGAKLFLVPTGQGMQSYLRPQESCNRVGSFTICETTYKQIDVDISETAGIQVKEVSNIADAIKYFL